MAIATAGSVVVTRVRRSASPTPDPGLARRVGVGGEVLARMAQADIPPEERQEPLVMLDRGFGLLVVGGLAARIFRRGRRRSARRAMAGRRRPGRSSRRRLRTPTGRRAASSIEATSPLAITGIPDARHDLGDALPIGAALVELLAGAAMDRDRLDAERFAAAGKLGRVDAILVPAEPHLHRDGHRAAPRSPRDKPARHGRDRASAPSPHSRR